MENKTIYWIPIVGIIITLMNYEEDNGMSKGWMFYQAFALMAIIAIVTLVVT